MHLQSVACMLCMGRTLDCRVCRLNTAYAAGEQESAGLEVLAIRSWPWTS